MLATGRSSLSSMDLPGDGRAIEETQLRDASLLHIGHSI
jgi:hypothetical protein